MPVATIEVIPDGWRGTKATVDRCLELIQRGITDLLVEKIADAIVTRPPKCDDRDYDCKARKIFDFVKGYVRFERDQFGVEKIQDAIVTLKRRAGDCDDHSILVCTLAGAIGFPYALKTIKADSSRPSEFSHIYAMLCVPKKGWVPLDTSVGYSYYGWEAPGKFEYKIWTPRI